MNRIVKGIFVFVVVSYAGCSWLFPVSDTTQNPTVVSPKRVSELPKASGHTEEVLLITPIEGSKSFITAARDGQVLLWTGSPLSAAQLYKHPTQIDLAALDVAHKVLALSSKSIIYVIDLEKGEIVYKLDRIKARHLDLKFSPDGKALYFGATDNNIYRWKFVDEHKAQTLLDREKAFERYNGAALPVSQVAPHPNGRIFFSGDWNGGVNGWMTYDSDRQQGYYDDNLFGPQFYSAGVNRVKFPRASNDSVDQLELSPDGALLFIALKTGILELYKVRGVKKSAAIIDHIRDVFSMAVSSDGSHVVTAGRDELIHLIKVRRDTEEELKAKDDRSFDFELTIEREIHVPDIQVVAFQGNSSIIAGSKTGAILEIPINQMPQLPTPAPTPTHTPRPKDPE